MHGVPVSYNPFFDPFAAAAPRQQGPAAGGSPPPTNQRRGQQSAAEHRALRAASLLRVSSDLARMVRERRSP